MSKPTTRIIERQWRTERHVTEAELRRDLDHADRALLPVHRWTGDDRSGQPLTVVWVAGPETGALFSAYEISGYTE